MLTVTLAQTHLHLKETGAFILVVSEIADQNNKARRAVAYERINEDNTK